MYKLIIFVGIITLNSIVIWNLISYVFENLEINKTIFDISLINNKCE